MRQHERTLAEFCAILLPSLVLQRPRLCLEETASVSLPFGSHCCHMGMGMAIKHPVPDRVKPSFVIIFDNRAL